MAESESGADKSEEPTSKRLDESRKKGQIARSRELNTVVVTMTGIGGLLIYGADLGQMDLYQRRRDYRLRPFHAVRLWSECAALSVPLLLVLGGRSAPAERTLASGALRLRAGSGHLRLLRAAEHAGAQYRLP